MFPSFHHRPSIAIHSVHYIILGFSAYIVVCGIKAMEMMHPNTTGNSATGRARAPNWTDDEIRQVLRHLIAQKASMGDTANYPLPVFNDISRMLKPNYRSPSSIQAKWGAVKKAWGFIQEYNKRSGCYFHPDLGLNVQTQAEKDAWTSFAASHANYAKELEPYMDKPFAFYHEMQVLLPDGAGRADGVFSADYPQRVVNVQNSPSVPSTFSSPGTRMSAFGLPPPPTHDFRQLAELGREFCSTNPNVRMAAAKTALSTLSSMSHPVNPSPSFSSQTNSNSRIFSSTSAIPQPSSHTSFPSTHASKGKRKATTPAISALTSSPSVSLAPSKRSRVSQVSRAESETEKGQMAVWNEVSAVVTRAADCVYEMKDWFGAPPNLSAPPPSKDSKSSESRPPSLRVLNQTLKVLKTDTIIDPTIKGYLAASCLHNENLCEMYISLADAVPEMLHSFVQGWFEITFPDKACELRMSQALAPSVPTSKLSPLPVVYHDTQLHVAAGNLAGTLQSGPSNPGPSSSTSQAVPPAHDWPPPTFANYGTNYTGDYVDVEGNSGDVTGNHFDSMDFDSSLFNNAFE